MAASGDRRPHPRDGRRRRWSGAPRQWRGSSRARKLRHCAAATRKREHRLDALDARARGCQEAELHRDDHLALNEQIGLEGESVERDVDRALDGVLEGHEPQVDVTLLDRR